MITFIIIIIVFSPFICVNYKKKRVNQKDTLKNIK